MAETDTPTQQTSVTSVSPTGQLVKAITDQLFFHMVSAGTTYALFDDSQNSGQLVAFEIATDLPDVILQIYYYADNPTVVTYVNNFSMSQSLALGRGLTPGDVVTLPNQQTQDIPGRPSNIYPYLARFKLDNIPDFTAQFTTSANFNPSSPVIVLRFEPSQPTSYQRIVANIINPNPQTDATIITLDIKRVIFQDLAPGENPPPTPANQSNLNIRRTISLPTAVSAPSSTYGFVPPSRKPKSDELTYTDQAS